MAGSLQEAARLLGRLLWSLLFIMSSNRERRIGQGGAGGWILRAAQVVPIHVPTGFWAYLVNGKGWQDFLYSLNCHVFFSFF